MRESAISCHYEKHNLTEHDTLVHRGGAINQAYAQTTSIIEFVSSSSLNAHQDSLLERVKTDSFCTGWRIITINDLAAVQDSGFVLVNLPFNACGNLHFQVNYAQYEDDSNFYWAGELPIDSGNASCENGYFRLTRFHGVYTGRLLVGDSFYHIQDLSNGEMVFANENAGADSGWCGPDPGATSVTSRGAGEDCEIKVTKILMCFSQAAQDKVTNIEAELKHMVDVSNEALSNSGLKESIEMVGILKYHGFSESNIIDDDFQMFQNDAFINSWRDNMHADLCALVTREYVGTDGDGVVGMSSAIPINLYNKEGGYIICGIIRGAGELLVAPHEIGHCYRGNHELIQSATCAHAFDFKVGTKRYRTAIHIAGKNIIPYYSNKNITFKRDKATGDNDHNNFCIMNDYKEYMRTFYTEQDIFYADMLLETGVSCDSPWIFHAVAECGQEPYNHHWYISYDGINFTASGITPTLTFTPQPPPHTFHTAKVFILLKVQDDNGVWASKQYIYSYFCQ